MKSRIRSYLLLILVAGLIVLVDQWTKSLVRQNIPLNSYWSPWPWLTPYARIVHTTNTGAAFGMLQGFGTIFKYLAMIVVAVILYYYPKIDRKDWVLQLALMWQLGGAIGNLIDRWIIGEVTDFISVGNFAVFNLADASITIGVILLLLGVYLQDLRQKKEMAVIAASVTARDGLVAEMDNSEEPNAIDAPADAEQPDGDVAH